MEKKEKEGHKEKGKKKGRKSEKVKMGRSIYSCTHVHLSGAPTSNQKRKGMGEK